VRSMGEVVLEKVFFPRVEDKAIVLLGIKLEKSDPVKPGLILLRNPKGKIVMWIIDGEKVTKVTLTTFDIKELIEIFEDFLKRVGGVAYE